MIFVGDIALSRENAITLKNLPPFFYEKMWFGNLEGALILKGNSQVRGVYNLVSAIRGLVSSFRFCGVALANNHIFDVGNFSETIIFLEKLKVPFCGAGFGLVDANRELVIHEGEQQIVIVNFGWEVIQCEVTRAGSIGVNPLRRAHVLDTISLLRRKYPHGRIVSYMHWSYELEAEPQPFERDLSREIIDRGGDLVVGCHPHRVGGFEVYRKKPIIYSLGNWMFEQKQFFDGKLQFPEFCNLQLAFEIDFSRGVFLFHFFDYDRERSVLSYLRTEDNESETMKRNTPFRDMASREYESWYKKNRYHRGKLLPVYTSRDSDTIIFLKNKWVKTRDKLIKVFFNKGK